MKKGVLWDGIVLIISDFLRNDLKTANLAKERYEQAANVYEDAEKRLRKEKTKGQLQVPELLECERIRDSSKNSFLQVEQTTYVVIESTILNARKLVLEISSKFVQAHYDFHQANLNSMNIMVRKKIPVSHEFVFLISFYLSNRFPSLQS